MSKFAGFYFTFSFGLVSLFANWGWGQAPSSRTILQDLRFFQQTLPSDLISHLNALSPSEVSLTLLDVLSKTSADLFHTWLRRPTDNDQRAAESNLSPWKYAFSSLAASASETKSKASSSPISDLQTTLALFSVQMFRHASEVRNGGSATQLELGTSTGESELSCKLQWKLPNGGLAPDRPLLVSFVGNFERPVVRIVPRFSPKQLSIFDRVYLPLLQAGFAAIEPFADSTMEKTEKIRVLVAAPNYILNGVRDDSESSKLVFFVTAHFQDSTRLASPKNLTYLGTCEFLSN